ncbi:hypothetical protein CORC01_09748 [Colletotrichum orchidophilum]|uniref:Uncharacterized protein n=1 Tax=Colletotrichum orchidophilum TaxID=1209926 RepID=A0A1G4B0N8_9PEZI|nr:uncharacterized protein CORC01_09748 [Colletotrichum orchidophilum]OHE94954.1 hypothetical protein CORC01_09748 [Colletotrichum orchidophilum]
MTCLVTACRGLDLHTRVLLEVERNVGAGGRHPQTLVRDEDATLYGYGYDTLPSPSHTGRNAAVLSNQTEGNAARGGVQSTGLGHAQLASGLSEMVKNGEADEEDEWEETKQENGRPTGAASAAGVVGTCLLL